MKITFLSSSRRHVLMSPQQNKHKRKRVTKVTKPETGVANILKLIALMKFAD